MTDHRARAILDTVPPCYDCGGSFTDPAHPGRIEIDVDLTHADYGEDGVVETPVNEAWVRCTHPAVDTTFGDTCHSSRELDADDVLAVALDLLNTTIAEKLREQDRPKD